MWRENGAFQHAARLLKKARKRCSSSVGSTRLPKTAIKKVLRSAWAAQAPLSLQKPVRTAQLELFSSFRRPTYFIAQLLQLHAVEKHLEALLNCSSPRPLLSLLQRGNEFDSFVEPELAFKMNPTTRRERARALNQYFSSMTNAAALLKRAREALPGGSTFPCRYALIEPCMGRGAILGCFPESAAVRIGSDIDPTMVAICLRSRRRKKEEKETKKKKKKKKLESATAGAGSECRCRETEGPLHLAQCDFLDAPSRRRLERAFLEGVRRECRVVVTNPPFVDRSTPEKKRDHRTTLAAFAASCLDLADTVALLLPSHCASEAFTSLVVSQLQRMEERSNDSEENGPAAPRVVHCSDAVDDEYLFCGRAVRRKGIFQVWSRLQTMARTHLVARIGLQQS